MPSPSTSCATSSSTCSHVALAPTSLLPTSSTSPTPALNAPLTDEQLSTALEVIADFTDVKSPYTLGNSRAVADLLAEGARLRRAALVHDLGRLGVSNSIWDKQGELTSAEQERVRIHPYLTERMLASSPVLAELGAIAVQHHERLDGSGYPRGVSGAAITPAGRLLAAADMYSARREPRPHRRARFAEDAAAELRGEVRAGRLDGSAVEAVLQAAGHRTRRRQEWPAGLTLREGRCCGCWFEGCPPGRSRSGW